MSENIQPILETRGLTKHFFTGNALSRTVVKAVQDATLQVYPEKVVALVGESGSGKSTIVRMLAQLYKPTSGDIIFEGENIVKHTSRAALLRYRGKVQMIFQDPFASLNPVHKVSYCLQRPLRIHHKAPPGMASALHRQTIELLEQVSLIPAEDYIKKYPHQLSGGQRQRVAIARALAVEPKVILADEPVSMLDVSIRLGVLNLMDRLREMHGIGFLYVTHDLASARYFADEILVMYAGWIVEKAKSEELIQNPKHPYTQLLLSAVPDPSRGLRTAEIEIKGEIPNLANLGAGCPFAPRCSKVMEKCNTVMPPITTFDDGSWTRCYLFPNN
ncbi:MAG: ABC transporter ATP-binding protein [Chloroflexi bacterium]|nr:ABC transporter ATP-binding protein [Chloroflexota bacterium]